MITHLLKRAPYCIVFILVTGCLSALPLKHEYKSYENFPVPLNEVWELSSNFLEENVSAIDTADKQSGFLKTKEFNVPYSGFQYQSEYADCGKLGGLYTYHKIVGHYEIFISESKENRTVVSTIPHYRASLWLGKSFKGWIPCQSRGHVEQLLMDYLRTKNKEYLFKEALGHQQKNGVDKESDKKSTTDIHNIPANDNKRTDEPERMLIPEPEFNKLMNKKENAMQETEITILNKNKYVRNNDKKTGEADLPVTESPPVLKIISDSDVTTKLPLNSANKESLNATDPLSQGRDYNPLIYTVQTGSFLGLYRARAQFNLIAELLQPKDCENLRIEKIGSFYTVRLGKYDNKASAEDLLQKLINKTKSAVVLKAYMINDRIIGVYENY
jgi:hypothetical protein